MKNIFLFLVLFIKTTFAQYDLQYFIQSAYQNNPQLKGYPQIFLGSKLENELINSENNLPKISVSANYLFAPYFNNGGKYVTTTPGPDAIGYDPNISNGGLYSAQINVDKNIFNGYTTRALQRQVSIREDSLVNNLSLLKHDIEKQVTDQYLQTYLSLRLFYLEKETFSNIKEQLTVTAKLKSRGIIKESEYLLFNIEVDNQAITVNNTYSQFLVNMSRLLALCGLEDTTIKKIDSVSLKVNEPLGESAFNKKYRIDSLAVINQQIVFETKYQPQVSLFFNTGLNAVELTGIEKRFGLSAGFNFSLPIYDGNQKSITKQQNELQLRSISFEKEYFFIQLKSQQKQSLGRIQVLKNNLENLQRQVKSYIQVISISEKELQNGSLSIRDYLTTLRNFIDLKKNFIMMQNEYQLEINNYNYWNW
jgi:outer membrane protein TolC